MKMIKCQLSKSLTKNIQNKNHWDCYILIVVKADQLLSLMLMLQVINAFIFWSIFVLHILILRYKATFANIFLLI